MTKQSVALPIYFGTLSGVLHNPHAPAWLESTDIHCAMRLWDHIKQGGIALVTQTSESNVIYMYGTFSLVCYEAK